MESTTDVSQHNRDSEQLLSCPSSLMPSLFDSFNSDFLVFTFDSEQRLMYMSKSSWELCRLNFHNWERKCFDSLLTDHPWNDAIRNQPTLEGNFDEIQKLHCQILNDEGQEIWLEVHRKLVVSGTRSIGAICLAWRSDKPLVAVTVPVQANLSASERTAMPPMALTQTDYADPFISLTPGEKQVIELVIEGQLNKTIAKSLGLAMRTVELRRAKAMAKLRVATLADLVKLWCRTN